MLLGKSLSNYIVNVVVILTLLVLIFNIEPLEAARDLHVIKNKLMKVLVSQERAPTPPSTPDPCSSYLEVVMEIAIIEENGAL